MADKKPEDNGFPPVTVEQRGRFTVVTGDGRDPQFHRISQEVRNRFRQNITPAANTNSPAQQVNPRTPASDPQFVPSSGGPSSENQSNASPAATQSQIVPNRNQNFPPIASPSPTPLSSVCSSLSQSVSNSQTPHRPVPDPNNGTRTSNSSSPQSGSGSGIRNSRSGPPPFSSLSMAFFSSPQPQQQQTPFAPQFQFPLPPQQQQQLQMPQMQAQFQVPQPQFLLYTKERVPAGWSTKFEDLHQDSQNVLVKIEERIREYRDESEKLDQCTRLYDSSVSSESFEVDAARIIQEIGGTNTAIEREKASVQQLVSNVKDMIRSTELAIHTYMTLRPHFIPPTTNVPSQNNTTGTSQPSNPIIPASPSVPVFDFYSGVPKRPSAFLQHTVERLQRFLEECIRWIDELEQLVQIDANRRCRDSLEALPKVMANVHDYFIYVASKVEKLHQYMESVKTAYLIDHRRRGDDADPFLEANHREAARLEAAARRFHPTLHLPHPPQTTPTNPNPNPTPTPTTTTAAAVQQQQQQQTSQPAAAGFLTPAPALSGGGGLFSTPSGATPSPSLFGPSSSGFTPQSGSLFGSTPAAPAPSGAAGSALFATPTFGGANVSGASFGGASKSTRPKTRTSRR